MGKDNNIIHETERLLFRRHIVADVDAYCAMEMDPLVRRYVGGNPRTRAEAEKRFNKELENADSNLGMRALIFKPNNCYIGRCGLYPQFKQDGGVFPGEAALGYYIASDHWGRGLATEAAAAFTKFGFETLKLIRIVTMVEAGNNASVHILKKLGFELTETEIGTRSFYHFVLQNTGDEKS